jgi:hypothetical protein
MPSRFSQLLDEEHPSEVTLVSESEAHDLLTRVGETYEWPPGVFVGGTMCLERSVADLLGPGTSGVLRTLPISDEAQVHVLLNVRDGASMPWKLLCDSLDDLWFPSADDLLVITVDLRWIIQLSHEEWLQVVLVESPGARLGSG